MATTTTTTTATEKTASELLVEAADLIRRAADQLDTSGTKCSECRSTHYKNLVEARVWERIVSMPQKLRGQADRLDEQKNG